MDLVAILVPLGVAVALPVCIVSIIFSRADASKCVRLQKF